MNWTTREVIEGLKCIVETNTGCVFPAQVINGVWWNTEKAFPIDGVKRWIPYPEGGNPNDEIPIEILFKYLHRDFKKMKEIAKGESEKVKQLKKLNKELVSEFNNLYRENEEIRNQLANKDIEKQEEMKDLYKLINEISAERDELKKRMSESQPKAKATSSAKLLRENKQMKAFLRSIMNTCDTMRELEIA